MMRHLVMLAGIIWVIAAAGVLCSCQSDQQAAATSRPGGLQAERVTDGMDVTRADQAKPGNQQQLQDTTAAGQGAAAGVDATTGVGAAAEVTEPQQAGDPVAARLVQPGEGIEVDPDNHIVRLAGHACLDVGWLEQIACTPGTREYEALFVLAQKPSLVHASMLMAGFEAGTPGRWTYDAENKTFDFTEPTGSKLLIEVAYTREGAAVREPIRMWIRDHMGREQFPNQPWVFGGSAWQKNNEWMRERTGQDEHYVADMTGSIIGLVTFSDEVIGFSQVISDDVTLQPAEWEVNTEHVPPMGTEVTLIISPWPDESDAHHSGASDGG